MKNNKTALITGASKGLGFALADALADRGWNLIINARNAEQLLKAQRLLEQKTRVEAISGNVIDEIHLIQLPERVAKFGGLDLIINNASTLGMSPQPHLLDYPIEVIHTIFHTNLIAPLSLLQKVKNQLKLNARIINVSSDAAIGHYEGWGGYGASKAALDHLSATLAVENPQWKVYAIDPGEMQTSLYQAAFPKDDISGLPLPTTTVASFLRLIEGDLPSGRYVSKEIGRRNQV